MLKFKTSCAVLAYLSSNLLNEVVLSLFRYFEVGLRVCDIVVKKLTFAISSPDEFLYWYCEIIMNRRMIVIKLFCGYNVKYSMVMMTLLSSVTACKMAML